MEKPTEKYLAELIALSNRCGSDSALTLYGGGSASCKDENNLYIGAEGLRMGNITQKDICALDTAMLRTLIGEGLEGSDGAVRERILSARLPGEDKIPSEEALLHAVFPQCFVCRLQPTLLNAMTCARQGEVTARILYGGEALWVPETKPGYALACQVAADLAAFREKRGHDCALVFLQNQGVLIAADDIQKLERLMTLICQAVGRFTPALPAMEPPERAVEEYRGRLGEYALLDRSAPCMAALEHPDFVRLGTLTPDHMAVCGARLLRTDREHLKKDIAAWGEPPRIVGLSGVGIFACGQTEEKSREIMAYFRDAVRILHGAEGSGGVRFMSTFLVNTLLKMKKTK